MQESVLTQVLLPLILAVIMFGMGLSLIKEDFTRLWKTPKPIAVGLFGQILILPILAYAVAIVFGLSAELAIGLMILAACPGGTMSNVVSHLARANLALSVSLTAVTTVICVFTTPWIIKFAIEQFSDSGGESFSLLNTSLGLVVLTLLPVLLGIVVRAKWSDLALKIEPMFRKLALIFMIGMIGAIIIDERDVLIEFFGQVFWATLALNMGSIIIGILLGKVSGLAIRDQITLGIEVGIQNASMAMLIAITFLSDPALATSAGIYGLTMYIGAGLLALWSKKHNDAEKSVESEPTL